MGLMLKPVKNQTPCCAVTPGQEALGRDFYGVVVFVQRVAQPFNIPVQCFFFILQDRRGINLGGVDLIRQWGGLRYQLIADLIQQGQQAFLRLCLSIGFRLSGQPGHGRGIERRGYALDIIHAQGFRQFMKQFIAAAVALLAPEAVKPGFDQGVEGGALGLGKAVSGLRINGLGRRRHLGIGVVLGGGGIAVGVHGASPYLLPSAPASIFRARAGFFSRSRLPDGSSAALNNE